MEGIDKYPRRRKHNNFFNLDDLFPDPHADFLSGGFGKQRKKKGGLEEFEPSLS